MSTNITQTTGPQATLQTITAGGGLNLVVEKRAKENQVELLLRAPTQKPCVLHWGLRSKDQSKWHSLPQAQWPEGTAAAGPGAMQTRFKPHNGESRISIELLPGNAPELLEFVLFFPEEGRWDDNGRRNYQIVVPNAGAPGISSLEFLKKQLGSTEGLFERAFEADGGGELAVGVSKAGGFYHIVLVSDVVGPLALHWGIAKRSPGEWLLPPESWRPTRTTLWGGQTAQTPFELHEGFNRLELRIPEHESPLGIQFVLKKAGDGAWIKHHHGNFYVPVHSPSGPVPGQNAAELTEPGARIVQAETGSGSWTLMHRFNLCFDLLGQAQGNPETLALLYVWLRYSAIRQLTWQRNYNTKPRELAHAQDRLSDRLADLYRAEPQGRPLFRLMLATIGRGGDGQRIRDEILQIMHRHHLKEVTGHFLEEWHQKLHNNTTPDDVVICEAYLEFLRSNGNVERFYETLQRSGVTRERLASFERPIRSKPDFPTQLKDSLIHDFENFLKILKAVHSSTDLETAINAGRDRLDADTQRLLWDIWNHRDDAAEGLAPLIERITDARRRLARKLNEDQQLRPLLYLDLALEQLVRTAVERNLHQHLSGDQLIELIGGVLENATFSHGDAQLGLCLRHWQRLATAPPMPRLSAGWSLHAKSVADRLGRALSDWTDRLYKLLQPKAESLGQAFRAEPWTISLFSEEVVRGSSLGFTLSMLLQQMDRVLRKSAKLGDWQIVSRGRGTGKVEVVDKLGAVQGRQFETATVVIADKVTGDEELPEKVVAVLAPDVTDLVSHVAVRARNAQVLFASCTDPKLLEQLKSFRGRFLDVEATPAGDVVFQEVSQASSAVAAARPASRPRTERPQFSKFALTLDEFNERVVGSKSCSQARLRGKLPEWIQQPASVALPFGCFERVLASVDNRDLARQHQELAKQLKGDFKPETLASLRKGLDALVAPQELRETLEETFARAGLVWPGDWESSWRCIKQVWASKWNDRAVLSRKRMGLSDEDLSMAVLVQPVVEADYAFVIHTVNPSNNNPEELYAEMVLGLGETLVGNFPGRALSFIWDKRNEQARLVSFPSKSVCLYGGGLIFRSDSNGEDLAGYAGAGLYDSVLLQPPREVQADYTQEPLVWDEPFRNGLLAAVSKIGLAIEKALGSAQDIEGAIARGKYFVVQSRPQVGLPGD